MKKTVKNILLTTAVLTTAFMICLALHLAFDSPALIPAIFVLAVLLVSFSTEGYVYGIVSALISVLALNYAFTFPFFKFNFTIPENLVSAIIMIIVTLITGALTTKLKHQEAIKARSEKERMRSSLLRAVGHDLRTPLTTIYGSTSAILENYDSFSDEQKQRLLRGIKEDSEWLTRMVENLLSVTRLDSGSVKLIKSPTALEELVDSVLQKFRKRFPDVNVQIDIPDEFLSIPMDAILIEQVIVNLLENSARHAEGMTAVKLRVFTVDKKAVFEISDDGCGIPTERLKTIFTGYWDGIAVSSDTKSNSGIGLSVCDAIIKAHGGEIKAENQKSGGALFRFALDFEEDEIEQ